ncbi:DUF3618 domain-containing protein [Streptomyces sp. NPDC054840]
MIDERRADGGTRSPDELRERVERTREELGQTIEAPAGKADIAAQAKEKTAAVSEHAAEKTAAVVGRIRGSTWHAVQLLKDTTPDPILDRADQAARLARANRRPLLLVGVAMVVFLLVRRSRACR